MDAPDADADVKLRKLSAHLIADIDGAVGGLVRRRRTSRHAHGRVRARMEMATTTIDMFLELPQLLDPHLPTWIPLLADAYLACCRSPKVPSQPAAVPLAHALCRLLYALCKVRGEKVVVRFLPVDVRCLEVLLGAMEAAEAPTSFDDDDGWRWEQRYVVLLWLSHLLLAPFDLATISSADVDDDALSSVDAFVWPRNLPSISARLTPLAMRYLAMPGKEHDAARALLVRLALRRDMQRLGLLDALVDWALAWLQPNSSMGTRTTWFYLGLLSFLGGLLTSTGETSDMDAHLPIIFRTVHRLTLKEDDLSRTLTSLAPARKTMLKVMRCVAVSFLRRPSAATTDVVETTIGHFLESLADNDTPVRLAASKALSVVTLRLAPAMAEQVVDAVLDSLDRNVVRTQHGDRHLSGVDPLEWHGLMLTLSHLLFRRSPPATQLAPILRALILGLSFEKRSTAGGSVGANVRDAACFGIWAAARRYTTRELLLVPAPADGDSMLQLLATELVVTASLDPAGNIRRGASAALQELIGRHPDVMQQGIAVVQTVDYHAVARRSRAVADVAVAAARLSPGYADALVHGILGWRGIGDSHAPWRRAAAAVFGLLAAEQSDGSRGTGRLRPLETCARRLTQLIKALAKRQVQELHGSLLCLASVLDQAVPRLCRSKTAQQQDDGDASTWTVTAWMHEMLSAASDLLLLADCRDRKPELVAEGAARLAVALCPLVQAKAQPQAQLRTGAELLSPSRNGHRELNSAWDAAPPTDADVSGFLSRLRGAMPVWLSHNEPETVGWTSLAALMLLVFSSAEERDHLLQAWADVARRKPAKRGATAGCGYFRALGLALPLADKVQDGGEAICEALVARWQAEDDIDTKVALLASIISSRALEARPERFIGLLKQGLGDYTTNARGDVGSHVRVEALRALRALWERSREDNDDDDDDDDDDDGRGRETASLGKLLPRVLSLAAERLDRVRPEAQAALALALKESQAEHLVSLGHSSKAYFLTLLRLASDENAWLPTRVPRPDVDECTRELLAGLVTSADTGNDDLVVASRAALSAFCSASDGGNLKRVCAGLVCNLDRWRGADRVVIPTLDVTAFLFHGGLFPHTLADGDDDDVVINTAELCRQTQRAGHRSGNVRKLVACIRLYGGVAAQEVGTEARRRLGSMLAHPWPTVRSAAVDEAWALLTRDGEADGRDKAASLLGVDWAEADAEKMRSVAEALGLGL
ncbi:hypothetical protein XA68_18081 [Ophiocordyceps unilateralis]|uniref:Uncharacterized protein n=1 Tax=Ophiocordyceps unilateralis TaxID=268505 RepID=A0A2A9P3V9_OPHUN|nr:hypothetical protein XA68_18081 [Ophiocordyceps unilateralis]